MPSERFYKLEDEKRERILDASMDEFAEAGFYDASINQIIKEADISRGSFYTYFEDKNDLFSFLFEQMKLVAAQRIIATVKKCNGNIFEAARDMINFAVCFRAPGGDKMMRLYNKLMTDFSIMNHLGDFGNHKKDMSAMREMLDEIYEVMDDMKNHLSRERFNNVADMMITESIKALILAKRFPKKKTEIIDGLFYQYTIMEQGVRAEQKIG